MQPLQNIDIFVSGGGIAGLIAAAAFGQAGFSVILVDPNFPSASGPDTNADWRTTAFLQPARTLLDRAGVWGRLAPFATPLATMRIMDAGNVFGHQSSHDFNAHDISDLPFGWNLPNWIVRQEVVAHLNDLSNVNVQFGAETAHVTIREDGAHVSLRDGARIRARLVIAADGRQSPLRTAAGIRVRTVRYGQKALAFAVTHPIPHANVSTEIHRAGGPFTLVPLPDHEGRPASAVVWMERAAEALRLSALSEDAFNAEITERSVSVLGPLSLMTRRALWPIIGQIADRMETQRMAFMAEAAHVLPPIGAQGLNTSLADVAVLLNLVEKNSTDPGARGVLHQYHRVRYPDVMARWAAVGALNHASMAGGAVPQMLRQGALAMLHDIAPLRRALMRAGLGAR